MLTLKIENFDSLPDGGPLEFTVDRRGFDFGRDQHLDWTLPDRNRVISGKHCEVRFYEGAYWLTDISTNGTYVNGSSKRVQSPYRLANGDRLAIGDYVVAVSVKLAEAAAPAPQRMESFAPQASNAGIWDTERAAPPPIDAAELMPRSPEADGGADFLHHAAYVPEMEAPPVMKPAPAAPAATRESFWNGEAAAEPATEASVSNAGWGDGLSSDDPAPPSPSPTKFDTPKSSENDSGELARRFAAGAGLPADLLANADAGDLAEEAGMLLNLACLHMMAMLRARTEAKALSRSGSRTMISSENNNPLKFMPTPEEALRVMLGPKTRGYLDAKASIDNAFADLKMHHVAMLAAMQAAVTELFDELSPDAVKNADGKKSLLSTGKSRFWDIYAERWAKRVGRNEHGMLGAFLDLFAEHYDKLSSASRNRHQ
jgi:type VI secretion system protein ImpI